jgi:hypothetical protein
MKEEREVHHGSAAAPAPQAAVAAADETEITFF